VDADA
jgi:ATP-dependent RNA helicase DDX46/PRP5